LQGLQMAVAQPGQDRAALPALAITWTSGAHWYQSISCHSSLQF
jgi:hypothetical protein